ncbi:MAG: ABC transporter substrate-binding protein [Acetobacteraceae bacterium]|nr:ABC transporter substrate-binding protein [Acetobacteraceae bacterium]
MVKAMASSKDMRDKVDLQVQVAGPNAQRQIQQINAMVQAGAKAIIVYPISPTALNQVVKNACERGVLIFAYDAVITEPCAYNETIDQDEAGRKPAEWLVKQMGGKGNIVVITGVPGTSVDTARTKAAKDVFAKYPDIHIIAEGVGMWSQAVARTELSKIVATHPWSEINGLWMQVGCFTAAAMQEEAGIADKDKKPCAGEGSNGHRIQMLRSAEGLEGVGGSYRPMGYPSISYASPPYSGALALKHAVEKLEGRDVPKLTTLPLPLYTNDQIKLCKKGTWQEMSQGCNVFQPAIISNPGWFASIFSAETPEVGLQAALASHAEE